MNIISLFTEKHLNIWKTLWFNFKYLPFNQAKEFPFYLYGKISTPPIGNYRDHISLIPTFISQGMIKLGCYKSANFFGDKPTHTTIINLRGKWIIKGAFMLSNGSTLAITKSGVFETGHDVAIGPLSRVYCKKSIVMGRRTRTSWDTQIFDTNFHYTIKNGVVSQNKAPVRIGNYCWIGNKVSIMPSTQLPDHSVVASNSLVNRNFSECPQKSLFAGSPAKYMLTGIERLFADQNTDLQLDDMFDHTTDIKISIEDERLLPIIKNTLNFKDGLI